MRVIWLLPIPAIIPVFIIICALFLLVVALQYWWISLLVIAGLIVVMISQRMARRERYERARHLAEPPL